MIQAGGWQVLTAVIAAGAVSLAAARRLRWLTRQALPAAIFVGLAVVCGTGAGGGLLLLVVLCSTSALSTYRAAGRLPSAPAEAVASPGRGPRQVWANGAAASLCAALALLPGNGALAAGVAGALAAAMADSWATEIGTALRRKTILLTSLREVEPGTSGGVSIAGTLGGLSGSLLAGGLVALAPSMWATPWGSAGWPGAESALATGTAVVLAGTVGMLVDSYLGAALEGRRPWIDNEVVNLLATSSAAAVAVLAVAA